ncbi:MAG TPA: hypothetical protein VN690_01990 [Terriglobales bacterium]|nr:hypothetical protein [Terriglobales bacterium]
MPYSTHKKVVVRHRHLGLLAGFFSPEQLESGDLTKIELARPTGESLSLPVAECVCIYFVARFSDEAALRAPRPLHRGSARQPGVWLRLRLADRSVAEGVLASDLLLLERGIWLSPLGLDSAWQRIFVFRAALEHLAVIEVVRPPRRRRTPALLNNAQPQLFGAEAAEGPQ